MEDNYKKAAVLKPTIHQQQFVIFDWGFLVN